MKTVLSGVKPTGVPHIGNYFGAMKQFVQLQEQGNELFIFIADYHALTSVHDAAEMRANTRSVALDYLGVGLDPARIALFRQSDVPEVTELSWILGCVCPKGMMDRAHAFKDAQAKNESVNIGLYTYPVLMAADILIYDADLVPVGQDQKQHVEYAQDLQEKFNHTFSCDALKRPEPMIGALSATVIGLDGRKMSKSYDNTIELFEPKKSFDKKIKSIVTDSTPVEEPKDPENCSVFKLYKLFDPAGAPALAEKYRAGGMGYGHAKNFLIEAADRELNPHRERRAKFEADPSLVEKILADGAEKARAKACKTMERVRKAVGIS
ncbi:MAG: tryptophan--tRNA ligase [Planctomycetes bacterium]|nr:tryptophan--tRNA ligase [Planctomycetota bacterium]